MSKRRSFGDDYEDRGFSKKPRFSEPEEASIEDKLDELIARIGEKSTTSVDKNIEDLANIFDFDVLPKNTRIVEVFCECVAEFPQKVCIYSTLIGLLNVRNYSFGGEVVEKLLLDFKKYLNQGQYEKARVLVRFFSDLVNTRVISSASLINLFENLIDVTIEDNIPQVRSDFFVYTVLSALPWSGKELFDKKEAELDQMLNTIDSYISKRDKSHHHPALRVWHTDEPHPQEEYLDCLWSQIVKLRADKWVEHLIHRPYLHMDAILCEALQHNIPPIKPPPHEAANIYPYPRVVFRLFDYTDCPERTVLPGTHSIERFIIEDNLRNILDQNCFDRKDCASNLLSYGSLTSAAKIPLEYIIIEVIFGELFCLPKSAHPEICYGSILLDICKLQPSTFPQALAQAVELLFDRLDTMNGYCVNRFASWFAYHLSNFQFRWGWDDWALSLKKEALHPKPKFIAETLAYSLRLSYHQKVLESVPATFHRLAPAPLLPKNKYMSAEAAREKAAQEKEGEGEEENGGGDENAAEKEKAAAADVEMDQEKEKEESNEKGEPKEELPGTAQATALFTALSQRCTADEALELLNSVNSGSAMESDDDQYIDPLKVDIFVTTLLNVASKSMTHCFASIARYQPVLKSLNKTEEAQMRILNSILEVWSAHQQLMVILIDKLMKSEVLSLSAVAIWTFSKANSEEFMKFYMWEILHSTIKRTVKNIKRCTKELNETKEKLEKVSSEPTEETGATDANMSGTGTGSSSGGGATEPPVTYEAVEKLEEKLDSLQNEQKNLFLIIFQRFIMVLTEHIQSCEVQGTSFRNYWFFWTLSRLQEVFFEYNEYIFKFMSTYETLLFTSDIDANILQVFKQFSYLRN